MERRVASLVLLLIVVGVGVGESYSPSSLALQDYFNLASGGPTNSIHQPPSLPPITSSITLVSAIEQTSAKLPCDLLPPAPTDKVVLVLWYKKTVKKPIFSFDVRGRDFLNAKKWADSRHWGARAAFRPENLTHPLTVQRVNLGDSGLYRCRVDFKFSPTRNSVVNLTVIVPPRAPDVYDREGRLVKSIVGPYNEGEDLYLMCQSADGKPPPELTWWRGDSLIDSSFDTLEESTLDGSSLTEESESPNNGLIVVKNELLVRNLQRKDLQAVFTCKAQNNNKTPPGASDVTLDMNFKPLFVTILNKMQDPTQALSTAKEYEILCQAVGSRPPPRITWWLGNFRLRNESRERTTGDLNTTTSVLNFRPELSDIGKALTCRAEHVDIPDSSKEDTWELLVHYKPIVTLNLGRSLERDKLDEEGIEEGKDVYFECGVTASPAAFEVLWKHNGRVLRHNKQDRVIISNHSLVLQHVTRHSAGSYSCHAVNSEGEGSSQAFHLKVKFAPICDGDQQSKRVFRISRMEKATVECRVESEPPSLSFKWAFNNTADIVEIPTERFYVEGGLSRLQYSPLTDLDYGSLQCWAANEIGAQKVPCVYHIIPVRKPDPPYNCSLFNYTPDSINVQCLEGYDGGLPQIFHLEVHDEDTQDLLANFSAASPAFQMTDLSPGRAIILTMYASNSKGPGQSIVMPASTPSAAAKRTSNKGADVLSDLVPQLGLTPSLAALLLGIASCLVFVTIAVVLAFKCRRKRPRLKHSRANEQQSQQPPYFPPFGPESNKEAIYQESAKQEDEGIRRHLVVESDNPDVVSSGLLPDNQHQGVTSESTHTAMTIPGRHWRPERRKGSFGGEQAPLGPYPSSAPSHTLPRNFRDNYFFSNNEEPHQPSAMTLHGTVLVTNNKRQLGPRMMGATLNRYQPASTRQYQAEEFFGDSEEARIPPPSGFGNNCPEDYQTRQEFQRQGSQKKRVNFADQAP